MNRTETNPCRPLFTSDSYASPASEPGWLARRAPSLVFYLHTFGVVWRSSRLAMAGQYDKQAWHESSLDIVRILESVGCQLHVQGLQHVRALDGPCIFIGNHMSTLETFVLPSLIMPWLNNLTFIVKRSLTEYPVFKHVMCSRNPVVVERTNPREDLKVVMEEGAKRLGEGYSLIIFPQHTRTINFQPEQFNSIGVKLARKAGVPVIPLALLTHAWAPGRMLKDYGPIIPSRPIHFAFGPPLDISGRGTQEHQQVIEFIQQHLDDWRSAAPDEG